MKRVIRLFILMLSIFWINGSVYAASLSIKANQSNVNPGSSVTVTVNASGLVGKFSVTSSNSGVLSGGTSGVWLENETKSYTFKANNIGSATITVKSLDVSDSNGNTYSESKSITINVVKPRDKSTNNNLKSLDINGYKLNPAFNKDTLEYTVDLESNVENITINATKEDSYASVEGTGEKEVIEGDNLFEITVTSESGTKKIYKVNAIVKDNNPIIKKIDGEELTVIKRESSLVNPDSKQFVSTTVTIDNTKIPAFYSEYTDLYLVGLKDKKDHISLYIYDEQNDSYTKYQYIVSTNKTIIFEDKDEIIKGFTKTRIIIDDVEYLAYQNDNNNDYVLIYGTCLENSNKGWYLYHTKEQTIQLYMDDIYDNSNEELLNNTVNEYKTVVIIMSSLSVILLIIILIVIVSKVKQRKTFVDMIDEQKNELEILQETLAKEKELKILSEKRKKRNIKED